MLRVPPSDREQVILVTLASYQGMAARLGFTAQPEVLIMREELETPEIVEEWRAELIARLKAAGVISEEGS